MKAADQNGRLYVSHIVEAAEHFNSDAYKAGDRIDTARTLAAAFDGDAVRIEADILTMARVLRKSV